MIKNTILFKSFGKNLSRQRGFGLIELIMAILILGFALTSLLKLFADVSVMSTTHETRNVQALIAQELIEEIMNKRFDELTAKDIQGNWSSPLGTDTGETSTNKSTFDDVDDFEGWAETLTGSYAGYSTAVSVDYVSGSNLDTLLTIPSPISSDWTPNFKRVTVTVSNAPAAPITLDTIITASNTA